MKDITVEKSNADIPEEILFCDEVNGKMDSSKPKRSAQMITH